MTYSPIGERSRAVLIGASDFVSPELPPLPAVNNNLIALFRALTDPETGILPPESCEIIQGPDSPDSMMQRLRRTAAQADDFLLVYYAGHGLRHERRDALYLTVRHTTPAGLDGSGVPYEWVRDVIADSPARARLLILDCCYSGLALDRMSGGGLEPRELDVSGTSVLASSPRNRASHSPLGERYTAFTGELLSVLDRGIPFADRPVTVTNVYQTVKAALARRSLPLPTLRSDDTSGQLLLRRTLPQVEPRPLIRPPSRVIPDPAPPVDRRPPPDPLPQIIPAPVPKPAPPPQAAMPLTSEHHLNAFRARPPEPPAEARRPDVLAKVLSVAQHDVTVKALSHGKAGGAQLLIGLSWFMATIGVGVFAGGFAGLVSGAAATRGGDIGFLVGGPLVASLFGIIVFQRSKSRERPFIPVFPKAPLPVLIVFALALTVLFVVALVDGPSKTPSTSSTSSTISPITIDVYLAVTMAEWALICARAAWLRIRTRGLSQ